MTSIKISIPPLEKIKFFKKIGEKIAEGEILAQYEEEGKEVEINLSQELNFEPKSISQYLLKKLGDEVQQNEILAKRQYGFLGHKEKVVQSPIKGKIFELDSFLGTVKIVSTKRQAEVRCPLAGEIKNIDEKGILIQFNAEEVKILKSFGESKLGNLIMLSQSCDEEVDSAKINADQAGKILFGAHFSLADLARAQALGIAGVIASDVADTAFVKMHENRSYRALGESAFCQMSLAVISKPSFLTILKHKPKQVYLVPAEDKLFLL